MINPEPLSGSRSPYSTHTRRPISSPATSPTNRMLPGPLSPKKKRRWVKPVLAAATVIVIAAGVFAGLSFFNLKNAIIAADDGTELAAILEYHADENPKFDPDKFTQIGQGRFNMLLVGIDKAAGLTDSIQVLSVDTINHKASVTSIPRDLYVTIPGSGKNKINAAYKLAEAKKTGSGSAVLKEIAGNVLGTPITNYALIDFKGLESLVDALGGIEIDVPRALYDPEFPADTGNGFAPFSIRAGKQTMNGKTALSYARCRKGNCGDDFGRSERQQAVIEAIRTKALSAGILTNPVRITQIMQALGKSFKTDLQVDQITTLLSIYNKIPQGSTEGLVLDTSTELGLLTSSSGTAAGYINFPRLGQDKYNDIHRWHRKNNPDPLLAGEAPTVTIAAGNTSVTAKQLADFKDYLTDFGYQVTISTSSLPTQKRVTSTTLYEVNAGKKPFARNYLSTQFGVTAQKGNPISSESDFEILYVPSTTKAAVPASPSANPTTTPSILE